MNRPHAFHEWWQWGIDQADACRRDEPSRLHQDAFQEGGHPGPWRKRGHDTTGASAHGSTISPQPFTPDFEQYLDAEPEWGPMRRAMARIYNPRKVQIHEYKILFALLEGHTDTETVRALIGGCRRDFFEAAAIRALSAVFETAKAELPTEQPNIPRRPQGSDGYASDKPQIGDVVPRHQRAGKRELASGASTRPGKKSR